MTGTPGASGAARLLQRLRRAFGPGRSLASRLLLGFFLAFLIPGTIFVFLLERRLSELRDNSVQQLAALRAAQASKQLQEDASFRAEWMDRRAGVVEEAAWSLARAAALALEGSLAAESAPLPPADVHGHVWTPFPEHESMAYLRANRAEDPLARRHFAASRSLASLMLDVRERRRSIVGVSLWTASGVLRVSPWVNLHDAIRASGGAERLPFEEKTRFPARRPPSGDQAVWMSGWMRGPGFGGDPKYTSLLVPVRDASGGLLAGLSLEVDVRGFVADSLERGERAGDVWFAVDPAGHVVSMASRTAELLRWRNPGRTLRESADPEQNRLARRIFAAPATIGNYRFGGRVARLASARVRSTGWAFVEGLSGDALARTEAGAVDEIKPKSFSDLKRYLVFVFGYLAAAVLAIIVFKGGLGNQLFQLCFYLYLKRRYKGRIYGYYKKCTGHNGLEVYRIFDKDIPETSILSDFIYQLMKNPVFFPFQQMIILI
jgi:hypothetical protein